MDLTQKKCEPCEGGVKPLGAEEINGYMSYLKTPWKIEDDGKKIEKDFKFGDFKEAMSFVNKVAELAEEEGHHPDIEISYNKVEIEMWTHSIGGLSVNDFILAAKIDEL